MSSLVHSLIDQNTGYCFVDLIYARAIIEPTLLLQQLLTELLVELKHSRKQDIRVRSVFVMFVLLYLYVLYICYVLAER